MCLISKILGILAQIKERERSKAENILDFAFDLIVHIVHIDSEGKPGGSCVYFPTSDRSFCENLMACNF